jgi:hypothetical protein
MQNSNLIKSYLTEPTLLKSFFSTIGMLLFFYWMLITPIEEKISTPLPLLEIFFESSNELRIIYHDLITALILYLSLWGVVHTIRAIQRKNYVYLFEDKITLPAWKPYLVMKKTNIFYGDIQFTKLKHVDIIISRTHYHMSMWYLYIYTSDGKKYHLSYPNKRKDRLFEIYDFIKTRISPEALNPPPKKKWLSFLKKDPQSNKPKCLEQKE